MEEDAALLGQMRVPKVKNQQAAEIQITAEQLIRESQAYRMDESKIAPIKITDESELEDYKLRTRKSYETAIQMQRHHMGNWVKYGLWEGAIGEI